jgi:hypothetical protein
LLARRTTFFAFADPGVFEMEAGVATLATFDFRFVALGVGVLVISVIATEAVVGFLLASGVSSTAGGSWDPGEAFRLLLLVS